MASLSKKDPPRQESQFRLIKRPPEEVSSSFTNISSKKPKTNGDDFVLRKLTFYGDKIQTNDEVHQSIELCPVMKALVDTEAFQRLRHIKQLGTSEYLYDCANGNRFQHSLGVAYLSERMCKSIKEEQPNLGVTDKDVLCVKLAGLLHDIGHGPYSHLYETFRGNALPAYIQANPELQDFYSDCNHQIVPDNWSHEESSLLMVDTALAQLGLQIDMANLDLPLKQIGDGVDANTMQVFKPPGIKDSVLTSRDFVFIKECILGKPLPEVESGKLIGRKETKHEWLYHIVNNGQSGLDMDKCDYFARDSIRAFGSGEVDFKMVEDARVAKGSCPNPDKCIDCKGNPGIHYMICYPLKRVETAMMFFKKRLDLHTRIYQNKKTVAAQCLLTDILCAADPFLRLRSPSGELFPPSRAVLNSDFLLRLDDRVLYLIANSTDPNLAEARALYQRFQRHDFYKCAVDQPLDIQSDRFLNCLDDESQTLKDESLRDKIVWTMTPKEIQDGLLQEKEEFEAFALLERTDIIVTKYEMHYGQKGNNPLLQVRFFDKMNEQLVGRVEDLPDAKQIQESKYRSIIPCSFRQVGVRIFCRDASKRGLVNQAFHQWFERMLRDGVDEAEATPCPAARLEFSDGEGSDDDDDDDNDQQQPICLSQESVEDAQDESDDYDPSPIAVRRRHR